MMSLLFLLLAPAFASVESLSYSGRLVNTNGSPVTGPVNLQFELSYTDDPSTVICSKDVTAVPLTNGVFHTRLDFTSGECGGTALQTVLADVPAGESAAVKVTDLTNAKAYTHQSLHAVPFSLMASMAKTLEQMGATAGQVLKWDGNEWAPATDFDGESGGVTSVATGTGLSGGPITTTGTISIASGGVDTTQLADGAVTNVKVAAGAAIARTKLASGTSSHVLVNDGSGVMTSVAQLSIGQGGTGASTAAGARTALELGTAASADVGMAPGNVIRPSDITICSAGEYLRLNVGPTYFWTCHSDASTDGSKLPLAGGTMSGEIAMGTNKITGLGTPTAVADAATKAYVDTAVSAVSHWTLAGGDVTRATGRVGIGTASAGEVLTVVGGNISVTDPTPTATEPYVGGGVYYRYQPIDNGGRSGISTAHSLYVNIDSNNDGTTGVFLVAKDSNSFAAGTELFRVQEDGAVGIGVAAPSATLHLSAGTATANTAPLKFTAGTHLTTPEAGAIEFDGANVYFTDSTATRRTFSTVSGAYASGSTINSAAGTASAPSLSFSGDTDTGFYSSAANQVAVTAGGSQLFTFDSNGILSASAGGGKVSSAAGSVSAPTFSFAGDTDTGWFSPAANQLAASNDGAETVRIGATGNVGIGTPTPARKLTVQGGASDNLTARFIAGTGSTDSFIEFKDPNTTADYNVRLGSEGDHFKIFAGGSERLRISSSGNAGIGATSPSSLLHLYKATGDSLINDGLRVSRPGALGSYAFTAYGNGTTGEGDTAYFGSVYSGGAKGKILFRVSDGTTAIDAMRIDEAGQVGVGVSAPTGLLHLAAGTAAAGTAPFKFTSGTNLSTPEAGAVEYDGTNVHFTDSTATRRTLSTVSGAYASGSTINSAAGTVSAPGLSFSGDTDTGFYSSAANQVAVTAGGSQLFTFDSNGLISSTAGGGKVSSAAGTVSAPTFSFAGDTDTGWFSPAANQLAASNGGVESVRIDAAGDVGIGTTAPLSKLQVVTTSDTSGLVTTYDSRFLTVGAAADAGALAFSYDQTANVGKISALSPSLAWRDIAIAPHGGNVGIGTSSPAAKLHVIGAAVETPTLLSMDSSSYSVLHLVTLGHSSTGYGTIGDGYRTTATGGSYKYDRNDYATMLDFASGHIRFKTAPIGSSGDVITFANPLTILNTGNIGMGVATPTGVLHLAAGTAAAGTAPLKLTAGTNLTTPEAGAMEFNGSVLYFTTGTTRHVIPFASATGSLTDITNISNSSGNITVSPAAGAGSVLLTGAASTGTSSGALIVSGGVGVSGTINAGGNITSDGIITALASMFTPQVYGSSAAGGDVLIDGTSHATKGDVLLATAGGKVGINVAAPGDILTVGGGVMLTGNDARLRLQRTAGPNYIEFNDGQELRIRSIAANDTNENIRMLIDTAGFVGIGTAAPSVKTEISTAGTTQVTGLRVNTVGTPTNGAGGAIEMGSSTNTLPSFPIAKIGSYLSDGSAGAEAGYMTLATSRSGTMTEAVRILDNGYVGIAMAVPSQVLDVNGNIAVSGQAALSADGSYISVGDLAGGDGVRGLKLRANDTDRLTILTNGDIGIGTTNPNAKLEIKAGADGQSAPVEALRIWGPNTPLGSNSAQDFKFAFSSAGSAAIRSYRGGSWDTYLQFMTNPEAGGDSPQVRLHINQDGNVGIGTTAPTAKIHIKNAANNEIQLGNTAGSFTTSTYFTDLLSLNSAINLSRVSDGAMASSFFSYEGTVASGSGNNLGIASRSDIKFVTGAIADQGMIIKENGKVGIGTNSPGEKLEVNGNVKAVSFISTSDRRLKTEIRKSEGLSVLKRISGFKFKWRDSGVSERGVMAQDVERVMPEAVVTDVRTGVKSVKYNNLFAPIIESLKELYGMISGQGGQIKSLSHQVRTLEERNRQFNELQVENGKLAERLGKLEALMLRQGKASR